ncbi:MAG TPA: hypothetical protein VKE30_09320 [Chthoniobacterales bacterium]|nr:hypothetical protein [Chthoniobacterales bacterium]
MADTDPVQSPASFSTWLGVVLLFVLFGVIVVAIVGPAPRGDSYEKMRAENRAKKLKDARDEDAKALTTYSWVDKNKGTVRLPIERAMQLTLADLANKKPVAAYPIAVPESAAAPGGQAAPSPAPSPTPSPSGTPKPISLAGQNSNAGGQPAAAVNPPAVEAKTQPGASASPAGSPKSSAAVPAAPPKSPAASPSGTPHQ